MEPIIITNLKGEWGFDSDEFPILGRKITNIDNGLNILASGFVDDTPYLIDTKIANIAEARVVYKVLNGK